MLSKSEDRLVRSLKRRKARESEGLFLAEGVRVVDELLAARLPARLVVVSPALGETERGRALRSRLADVAPEAVREVRESELRQLSATEAPQGVLAVASIPAPSLEAIEPRGPGFVVVLDGVQDPGNVGTLARSAAAFGCMALICLPGTADPWNGKAVRAAAGALFRVPVVLSDEGTAWDWLDRHGFAAWGADAAGEWVTGAVSRPGRLALAVGNEGAGLGTAVRQRCARLVAVPMEAGTESLNVAVAAGILMYAVTREAT